MEKAMSLRAQILAREAAFDAQITADFGEEVYSFSAACVCRSTGAVEFTVSEPQTIEGITGTVGPAGGALTFDDQVLSFPLLADGRISPVSAPWVLMRALRSGYLTSCAQEGAGLLLSIDDSYEEDALHLDIWLDALGLPRQAEIFWQGRRVVSMSVTNFRFL